jgi:hypothetical protein
VNIIEIMKYPEGTSIKSSRYDKRIFKIENDGDRNVLCYNLLNDGKKEYMELSDIDVDADYQLVSNIYDKNNNVKLEDTIELMKSRNHKDRFKAEYIQLKIRMFKLSELIKKYYDGELDFELKCNIFLLISQLNCMEKYSEILELRALEEKNDLNM